ANPLWGAPRIHGELQKRGVEISQAAVSKYVVRHRRPPSQSWRTVLDNHVGSLVAVDVFVVPTVMCKVLFVFLVLAHDRRRVVHVNVIDAPHGRERPHRGACACAGPSICFSRRRSTPSCSPPPAAGSPRSI